MTGGPATPRPDAPGRTDGGGIRASAVLVLVLVLVVAAAAVWWFLVPPELDPFPELRASLEEGEVPVGVRDHPDDDGEDEPVYRESPAIREEAGAGLPGDEASRRAGRSGRAGADDDLREGGWRPLGGERGEPSALPEDERPAIATSDPDDHVFTAMRASRRDHTGPFDPGLAADGMVLEFDGFRIPYAVFGVYVTPGETVDVHLAGALPDGAVAGAAQLYAEAGSVEAAGVDAWTWTAPEEPGVYRLDAARGRVGKSISLNAFVLTPASAVGRDGVLDGYRIGDYPDEPLRGLAQYLPPKGFLQVTPDNRDLLVSPHFTVGQFLCKQAGGWPKYVTLREEMLGKLEVILAEINAQGVRADTLFVMSGYRTPFYNRSIGNVRYSRHQWGDASDVFVDVSPRDGVMDDVDGDGEVSIDDAHHLASLVEGLTATRGWRPFVGGLGIYGTTSTHGPFIHVDTRGFKARWSG